MSASRTRLRLSLLSGGSLLSALVLAGAGGLALTPSIALAANECVPTSPTLAAPGDNGATADTYVCSGSYSSVAYTTNGVFTLRLQNNATTTTGGVTITGGTGNNITVNRLADSPAASGDPSLTSTSGPGLWVTNFGTGSINVNLSDTDADADTPMAIYGTSAGVLLERSGAGSTTFSSSNGTISASAGSGLDVTSSGTGAVNVTNGSAVSASAYGIRAGSATGNVTITNNGQVDAATGAILVTGGTNATITNGATGILTGAATLSNTGAVSFTNNGTWTLAGTSSLGTGATTLTNSALSRIVISGAATLDFAAGADTFVNAGALVAGVGTEGASTLTLLGLETWNNSGQLLFGEGALSGTSDGVANDRIVAAGTLFTGSGGSTLVMDVDLSADQASCATAVTADCFDLRGSSTAGATSILLNLVGSSLATAERVVLVDVAGAGTSGAGHFTLSEDSSGYRSMGAAGAVESGLYFYGLGYDTAAKQHFLEPMAFGGKALDLARISRAASEPWRTATGMWHDRQVDLRDDVARDAVGPGAWLKLAGNVVNQDGLARLDLGTEEVTYNTSFRQSTTAIVGGVDLMRMYSGDSAWVLGLTAGKLNSTLEYRVGASDLELDGHSLGAYATLVTGRLFVDAIVNSTSLDLTHNDSGQSFSGAAKSLGYQVESGYRIFEANDGGAYIEPLAAFSYVRTQVDDLAIGPVSASFGEGASMRLGVGLRVAGDMKTEALTARMAVTGRLWQEVDGKHETTLGASFGETRFIDNGMNTLADVGVSIGLLRPGGPLSANLAYSLKFGQDYQSSDASIGVRVRW